MAAREQMERVKPEEVNLKGMKSTKDQSKTYVLIQSFIKKLTLFVKQYFFHTCNKSDHLHCALKLPLFSNFCFALTMGHHGIFVYTRLSNSSNYR